MTGFGIGQPVRRTEDPRFLTGRGGYVDDVARPHECRGYALRSPHAHARVVAIDADAARAVPGVLAVLTGADADADELGGLPCQIMPAAYGGPAAKRVDHPVIVRDRARHVGDIVAFVVAETLEQARDAAELVRVEYEVLPAVVSVADADRPGAPLLWDDFPDNVWYRVRRGDAAAVDAAFAAAAHVTRLAVVNNRISANAIEPRAALAEYEPSADRWTLWVSGQGAHRLRPALQAAFGRPGGAFRVICPDVGGGFGMKGGLYPEVALAAWASRRVRRAVRWTAERGESLLSDTHARDAVSRAELALDADGKMLGLRVEAAHALGAYLSHSAPVPSAMGSLMHPGPYRIPAVCHDVRAVFTNTAWTGPYRGAGRPEATHVVERLVDAAARELAIDPVALRRRNYVDAGAMPYETPLGTVYDSGDFEAATRRAMELADLPGFASRRAESEAQGLLRGIGVICFIEFGAILNDRMEIRFDDSGACAVVAGTHSHGQGHETIYAQLLCSWLGVPFDSVRLIQGDTDAVSFGRGTYGSRSMTIGGSALKDAADNIVDKARRMAAHLLEAAEADIAFADGRFTVAGTDRSIALVEIAKASHAPFGWPAELGIGLEAAGSYAPTAFNYPNGCHVCEVELDPETGRVELVRYTGVDDSGVILNPLLYEGQIHGGLAQGIGQALMEDLVYDRESGQLLSGSFMDYCMPRADDLPSFTLGESGTACATNPLGVKGAGESGTVAATPVVQLAILDAMAPHGVADVAMPATAERVWRALRAGRRAA